MNYHSERIIRNKVGLLNLAEELGNISKACKIMGFSQKPSIGIIVHEMKEE